MKPQLTFEKIARSLARWSWFLLLCGIGGAFLAFGISAEQDTTYRAEARVHVVHTVLTIDAGGGVVPSSEPLRTLTEFVPSEFIIAPIAKTAVDRLDGSPLTPTQLQNDLEVDAIKRDEFRFAVEGTSQDGISALLGEYRNAYLNYQREAETAPLREAERDLQSQIAELGAGSSGRRFTMVSQIDGLRAAESLVPQLIAPVGSVEVSEVASPLPTWAVVLGGFLAGTLGAALLALLFTRLDPRVRHAADLEAQNLHVVEVDASGDVGAFQALRAELELAGLGRGLRSVAVGSPGEPEVATTAAAGLARAFAASGRRTVLVSANLPATPGIDVPALLESGEEVREAEVADNLVLLAAGPRGDAGDSLFSGLDVERLLVEAGRRGEVVVFDGSRLGEGHAGLLVAAQADVTVIAVARAATTWSGLTAAVERLRETGVRRVVVCLTRGGAAPALPAMPAPAADAGRRRSGVGAER